MPCTALAFQSSMNIKLSPTCRPPADPSPSRSLSIVPERELTWRIGLGVARRQAGLFIGAGHEAVRVVLQGVPKGPAPLVLAAVQRHQVDRHTLPAAHQPLPLRGAAPRVHQKWSEAVSRSDGGDGRS
jgi:hypothetical protein